MEIEFGVLGDFPYSIWEHPTGKHLCGYLGLPPVHPWYGKDYDEIGADVHGGLTYGKLTIDPESDSYPHDTGLDIWWVGFDCAHLGDLSPGWPTTLFPGDTYKDRNYVFNELKQLAAQASEAVN